MSALLLSLASDRDLDLALDHDLANDLARDLALARYLDRDRSLSSDLAHDLNRDSHRDRNLARDLTLSRGRALALGLNLARDLTAKQQISEVQLSLLATSFLQEGFFPNLSRSWPVLGLQSLEGTIADAVLTAPAGFHFDLRGRTVLSINETGMDCPNLAAYDLCFPMTAIPLGRLRRKFPIWREDRRYRPLGVLPFLVPETVNTWRKHAKNLLRTFPIGEIYAFQPDESLWFKPFAEWTPDDWNHKAHRSMLWDIKKGIVLRASGVHNRDKIRKIGKPFTKFD